MDEPAARPLRAFPFDADMLDPTLSLECCQDGAPAPVPPHGEMPVDLSGRPDTQGAQGSLGRPADDLTLGEPIPRRPCRKPLLGQIPPSLDRRTARHHDPSLEPKDVEHLAHVAVVGPAGRAPTCRRAVFEVPHPQWPPPAKRGDDVPPKAEALLDPFH